MAAYALDVIARLASILASKNYAEAGIKLETMENAVEALVKVGPEGTVDTLYELDHGDLVVLTMAALWQWWDES